MSIAKVGDINIEYYVEGEGPPLLLIVGGGGNASSWGEPFLELLRPHFQTIRFSHGGTGASDSPSGEVTMRTMADDAAGLLRQLGIERAHVLGLSMGGHVALELALNYPEIVQGLVLCGADCGAAHSVPASAETVASMGQLAALPKEEQMRQLCRLLVTPRFGEEAKGFMEEMAETILSTSMETQGRQMIAIQSFDCYDRLPEIKAQTLIIHGDEDIIIPRENAEILRDRIAGSTAHIMPGIGHVVIWEEPKESAEVIVKFLSSVPAPA